jgi:hypothetical protein
MLNVVACPKYSGKSRFLSGKKIIFTIVVFLIVHCTLLIDNCMSQWQSDVRLTNDPAYSSTTLNNTWCVASSGSVVHVVWYDDRDGNLEIYYKRSTDTGVSWGTDLRLTNNTAYSYRPSVAVSGSFVHVVWYDYRDGIYNGEIYYKRSTDGGVSWGADTRLTNNTAESKYPSIVVSGSFVHVVWYDSRDGNTDIYYKHSTDAGVSWGADTRLTNNSASSYFPSVAVSGSFVYVVWNDYRDGNDEIYYKRSTDAGVSWGTDTRLTYNTSGSEYPSVTVSGSIVHVVWSDYRDGNYEIYYKRSTDAGVSWGADTRLTNNTGVSLYPSVAVSGSVVHIVWRDYRNGNDEIYYKRSADAGVSWGADTRLTNNSSYSYDPSVAVSGSSVHVVWEDFRDGNREIYYKRDPIGNTIGIINISSEIPSSYSLQQNYPNPFNPTTKIKFDIPSGFPIGAFGNDNVVLKVFDILGKEITTLVNEQLAPGTYSVDFDGTNFPSGIYFYRLETSDFVQTNKMILLK